MNFITKMFIKSPEDLLAKGDRYFISGNLYDAKSYFEEGLNRCSKGSLSDNLKTTFTKRIKSVNHKMAELNFQEAEFAVSRGNIDIAIEHLHLVNSLTLDEALLQKSNKMLLECGKTSIECQEETLLIDGVCCSYSNVENSLQLEDSSNQMVATEYYDLLIRQLPEEQYTRYSELGEDFKKAYVAASLNKYEEALSLLESWNADSNRDIYHCERGKVLHRLGYDSEAEQQFQLALQMNDANFITKYNMALFLFEKSRLEEVVQMLDTMKLDGAVTKQSLFLLAELFEKIGDFESAIDNYSKILASHVSRIAAEKLYAILQNVGRDLDADIVFKRYLSKYCRSTLTK